MDDSYYRHLCEHAGVAMISTDRELNIRVWNAAAAQMFGASRADMIGASIGSVIPFEDRVDGERAIRESIEERRIINYEFQHRDAQGKARMLIVILSPVMNDEGECTGALACIRDITRRIDLETELAQRDKMASLGQMAGALSHHFNNILGGVVTAVDFALGSDNPHLHAKTLRHTSDALARASKLIDSLLAFAEGDLRHHDECDMTEVILEVVQHVDPEMAAQNIKLEVKLDPVPVTPVPRAQLVTVLENIFHNAADAMPEGGTCTVETFIRDKTVVISISDTGCGMDQDALAHVFEPFYSTKSLESDSQRHPGLGLAVAHGILQVIGHSICIESTPGKGTTISVCFNPGEDEPS